VGVIQNEIIPAENPQPVDRGAYRAGWRAEATPDGAQVINTNPVAGIIEHGARAENIKVGKKVIDALAEWVARKGLAGKASTRAARQERMVRARGIAWAIVMTMKKRGIFNRNGSQGLRVAEKALARAKGFYKEEMSRHVDAALRGGGR
jgi:hypothetical protein